MEQAIKEVERIVNQLVRDSLMANHPRHSHTVLRIFTRAFARSFLLAVFCENKDNEHKEVLELAQTILEEEAMNSIPDAAEVEAMAMMAEAIRKLKK